MSRKFESSPERDLEVAIGRLVADELDATDRRALLVHLDATLDGWRSCALAFLEDQAWRSALARPWAESVRLTEIEMVDRRPQPKQRWRSWARYAASITVATVVGLIGFRAGVASGERKSIIEVAHVLPPPELAVAAALEPGQPLGWIKLVNPAEGETLPRQVPILAATAANEQWLQEQPATIPPYVRAQWERRGYQVEEHHRLVGLDLDDGRRVAIPVDEVALDFVGRQPL